jgi:hypothetical protein
LKISLTNDFAKKINHHDFIYVVLIQSYKSDTKIKINAVSTFAQNVDDVAKKMFLEFKNFDEVFSLKNEKILANREKNVVHIIELKNDKQSSYKSFYNLFNIELKTFQLYFDDALFRDIIKHSISSIKTSILLFSKKKWKIAIVCELSGFQQNNSKKSTFFIANNSNAELIKKLSLFYQNRFDKRLQSNSHQKEKWMKNDVSHSLRIFRIFNDVFRFSERVVYVSNLYK